MPDSPAIQSHAILLPLPLSGCYDYRGEDVAPGDFVVVPLGKREQIGVVWGPGTGEIPEARLKTIIAKLDLPRLPEVCRRFIDRVAAYTLAPPGAVLRMAMSVSAALEPPREIAAWRLAGEPPSESKLTPARRRVLAALAEGPARPTGELAREGELHRLGQEQSREQDRGLRTLAVLGVGEAVALVLEIRHRSAHSLVTAAACLAGQPNPAESR